METTPTDTARDRLDRVQELSQFTEKCTKQLEKLIRRLGLSADYQELDVEALQQCPYDQNHRVPARSMDKHSRSCRLRRMGYTPEEQAEMIDTSVCYEKSNVRTFTMDEETQHQVIQQARAAAPLMKMEGVFWQGHYSSSPALVPHNHKRAVCDLTVADRLALYDHVIGALKQQQDVSANQDDLYVDLVSKLQKEEGASGPKTPLELMAEMRDYKRRRQSYRAKNVHITKKSYTEVIREVISVHSEELSRQWVEEEREEKEEESHSALPTSRSPSSESRHRRRHRSRDPESSSSSKKKKKKKKRKRSRSSRGRSRSTGRSHSRGRSRSRESRSPESCSHRHRKERE